MSEIYKAECHLEHYVEKLHPTCAQYADQRWDGSFAFRSKKLPLFDIPMPARQVCEFTMALRPVGT